MRKRRTARVLLLNPAGEVLLISFVVPRPDGDFHFWAAPGGEIEPAETEVEAAARELREELGISPALTGPIHIQANQFFHQGEMRDNTDFFFAARCPPDAPRLLGLTADEIRIMKEIRWWSPAQIESAGERIFPDQLAAWVRDLQAATRQPTLVESSSH